MSKGICMSCKTELSDTEMAKHLQSCAFSAHANGTATGPAFLVHVRDPYQKSYWLFIEASSSATLEDLDDFLRHIWLECCGHLSCFKINDIEYHTDEYLKESTIPAGMRKQMKSVYKSMGLDFDALEPEHKDMHIALKDVLTSGLVFRHEYDFGSTTKLKLQVVSAVTGGDAKEGIRLLARNNPPKHRCGGCGKASSYLCDECTHEGERGYFCEPCLKKHPCGDNMALKIANSPRMGVCGYSGPDDN